MASVKYYKSFTKPVAFTVGLLTLTFLSGFGFRYEQNSMIAVWIYFSLQMQVSTFWHILSCHIIDLTSLISSEISKCENLMCIVFHEVFQILPNFINCMYYSFSSVAFCIEKLIISFVFR